MSHPYYSNIADSKTLPYDWGKECAEKSSLNYFYLGICPKDVSANHL